MNFGERRQHPGYACCASLIERYSIEESYEVWTLFIFCRNVPEMLCKRLAWITGSRNYNGEVACPNKKERLLWN
jgi:hypothetical protein